MTWGAAVLGGGSLLAVITRFMQPPLETGTPGPVDAGLPGDYTLGSLTLIEPARAYLGRDERGFYAIVANCSHLGCTPQLKKDAFTCPCHGSRFARDGAAIGGPATRPLPHVLVGHSSDGHLFVDPRNPVSSEIRYS